MSGAARCSVAALSAALLLLIVIALSFHLSGRCPDFQEEVIIRPLASEAVVCEEEPARTCETRECGRSRRGVP